MKNRCKILMGDCSFSFGKIYAENLNLDSQQFEVLLCQNDGNAILKTIEEVHPQIVVMDYDMPSMDAVSLMKCCGEDRPYFIVMHDVDYEIVKNSILKGGASRFLLKPFSVTTLRHTILSLAGSQYKIMPPVKQPDCECEIIKHLDHIGVPTQLKGYYYIKSALNKGIENNHAFELITKILYADLAKEFDTSPNGVERAIRFAIGKTWARGNASAIQNYFSYNPCYNPERPNYQVPSNLEFLSKMAEMIRFEQKKQISR